MLGIDRVRQIYENSEYIAALLNAPFFDIIPRLDLHLEGGKSLSGVLRNWVGSVQDRLLGLLVEHPQLFRVPERQKCKMR